jgi:beta-lactamase regulating signal transducer with metallopeptidase domain
MIDYIIEIFFIHTVLIGIYWIGLRKENDYAFMRIYLIGSTIISIITPLIQSSEEFLFDIANTASNEIKAIVLAPVYANYLHSSQYDPSTIFTYSYWAITSILMLSFFISLIQVTRLIIKSKPFTYKSISLRTTHAIDKSFTFMQWILVEDTFKNDNQSLDAIVAHERAHVVLGHTYDILFLQLFKTIFWWMPTSWLVLKEIKNIHEYQADAQALKSIDNQLYSNLLISSTLKSHGLSLANSFYDGSIFKRLKTMKQKAKKLSKAKVLTLSSMVMFITIFFACNDQLDQDLKDIATKSYETTARSEKANDLLKDAQLKNPDQKFRYLEYVVEEGKDIASLKEKIADLDSKLIESVNVNKEEGIIGIVMREGQVNNYLTTSDGSEDEIFTMVEEIPTYTGGMESFHNDLSTQIKSIMGDEIHSSEGKVYIEFIVEKDGSLSGLKSLKASDDKLIKPSILALSRVKNWEPGQQHGKKVRVRMVMPIIYSLEE